MAIISHVVDAIADQEENTAHPVRKFVFCAVLGIILLFVNFPKFLTRTIEVNVAPGALRDILEGAVSGVQTLVGALIGARPVAFFERAMTCGFFLLWVFLALLAAFSLRRGSVRMLGYGSGGIVAGYFVVHLLAWGAVALVVAVGGALFVVRWVAWGIGAIVVFVAHYLWPLFLLAAAVMGVFIAYRNWDAFLDLLRRFGQFVRAYFFRIVGAAIGAWLLYLFVPALYRLVILPVWNFLVWLFSPVGSFILFLFKWIITIVGVIILVAVALALGIGSLALIGSLLVSQLQAGWHAARSLRDVLVAGFAIGSALALITLACLATPFLDQSLNHAWLAGLLGMAGTGTTHIMSNTFLFLLPESVKTFVFTYLTNLQAPAIDSFTFLAVMTLASLSVLFRLFSASPLEDQHPPVSLLAMEYGKIVGGAFVILLLMFFAAETGDSSA